MDENVIEIEAIDHVVLRVMNLESMLGFYTGVLGCKVERRLDDIGLVQLRAGSALLDLVPVDSELGKMGGSGPGLEGRNMDHLCFRLKTFDPAAISQRLEAAGFTPGDVASRYGAQGHGPSLYVKDPEHNMVELKGPI